MIIVLATLLVYWQTKNYGFLNFDDGSYVTENSKIRAGATVDGITWAFTATHASNWHPLTWLSHMLDAEFYGLNPGAHHLTNLLFHILNSLLLFYVLWRMTGRLWPSGAVAALFALHPLNVETVAWVSQRKNLLCNRKTKP